MRLLGIGAPRDAVGKPAHHACHEVIGLARTNGGELSASSVDLSDPEFAGGPDVAGATPTTLGLSSSLGTSFALVALVILLVLALVLGPALAWRHFSRRDAG